MKTIKIIAFVLSSFVLASCTQDSNHPTHSNMTFDLNNYDNRAQNTLNNSTNKFSYESSSSFIESNSYNRACPRLLQKEIDSSLITRNKEQMHNWQYCDYYIYPKKGQSLAINSHNSNIEVILIMPKFYDFANGSYMVETNRRHVIRVKYNGIENMPNDFIYDIDFKLD